MKPREESSTISILFVEDNKHDLAAIKRAFRKASLPLELTAVSRAEEALEKIAEDETAFDLVATDYRLPGMTGLELCKELMSRSLPLSLVLVTGAGSESLAIEALKLGVDDYLIKDHERRNLELFPEVFAQVVKNRRTAIEKQRAESALAREAGLNAAVAELASALLSPASLDEMSSLVLRHAINFTESAFGFVGHYDPEKDRFLSATVSSGAGGTSAAEEMTRISPETDGGLLGWAMRERRAVLSNSVEGQANRCSVPEGHPVLRRFLAAPAMIGEALVGQVALANSSREYGQEDLTLVERFASLYALAVQRQLAQDALERARDELETRVHRRTAELAETNVQLREEIAERRQAEAAKAEAEQELEKQRTLQIRSDRVRALGEMAAGIAHELSQPLVGVRGMSEDILLSTERGWTIEKDELHDMLSSIIEQADRMTHAIQHIRAFCREADKSEREAVDANEVVAEAVGLIGAQYRARGLELESRLAEDLPTVLANPYSLEEVVINLLLNARDALEQVSPVGGVPPKAVVETAVIEDDRGATVQIRLVDEGCGIDDDVLPHVFEPFFTTKEPTRGMGLGLSVARTIVESFGGEVSLVQNEVRGTTAVVSIPAHAPAEG